MERIERCEACKAPALVGRELRWGDNGVISLANSPRDRMVFLESEIIDGVFEGIEDITGESIEPVVIESRRRETRKFMERSFPFEVRNVNLLGERDMKMGDPLYGRAFMETMTRMRREMNERVLALGCIFGYGKQSLSEKWDKGEDYPWRTQIIRNAYSVPLWVADTLGTVEAFEGFDMAVSYDRTGEDTVRVYAFPGEHPVELERRLKRRHYSFKPGGLDYERCPECGVPVEVSRYRWDLEEGIITAADTGRRVAILGPLALEAVFADLESVYGRAIVEAAVEAQRRNIRSRVNREELRNLVFSFRALMALRGMGNITSFNADERGMSMIIENSCLQFIIVGTAQALYELAMRREESAREWDSAPDGDLRITIH